MIGRRRTQEIRVLALARRVARPENCAALFSYDGLRFVLSGRDGGRTEYIAPARSVRRDVSNMGVVLNEARPVRSTRCK